MISGQIKSELENHFPQPEVLKWYKHPMFNTMGGIVVTAVLTFAIAYWQFNNNHNEQDLRRDVALEVRTQLDSVKTDLSAQLSSRLDKQDEQIGKIREDVAEIKGADGIAKNLTPPRSLDRFQQLDSKTFASSLGGLQAALLRPFAASDSTIQAISRKLHSADKSTPDYWPTVLTFIAVISRSRFGPAMPPSDQPPVQLSDVHAGGSPSSFRGANIVLDGVELGPTIFQNCRIRFTAKQNHIASATFINCVFEFPDIPRTTPAMKKVGLELLASGVHKATVSAS